MNGKWIIALYSFALSLNSCQTFSRRSRPEIPAVVQSHFAACAGKDGVMTVELIGGQGLIAAGQLEWAGNNDGSWEGDMINPFGQSLLRFVATKQSILVSGRLEDRLPKLGVKGGYLTVDGNRVGIRVDELLCFLAFKLPARWLRLVESVETRANDGVVAELQDGPRDIRINYTSVGVPKICAELAWRQYLIFKYSAEICMLQTERRRLVVSGINEYTVQMVDADG
jgi:hypothetical protein